MDLFLEEHQNFLLLLLEHDVEFILIAGYAVIYHGYERTTADMDLWLKPSNENRNKFIEALKQHGVNQHLLKTIRKMDFTEPQVLYIGEKPNKIDFLTKLQSLDFEDVSSRKKYVSLGNSKVPVIHFNDLVVSKMLADRPQDKADIDMLQKIRKAKNKE
jgi:hypothetical protein